MFDPRERRDRRPSRRAPSASHRLAPGLLALLLLGLSLPAAAQGWPAESGPGGDSLRSSLRQFERLDPPPIEATGRRERAVPDLPPMALVPSGTVEVGMPVVSGAALPRADAPPARRAARRHPTGRRPLAMPVAQAPRSRERALVRELAAHDHRIRELERQIRYRSPR
ncbi:hypothetical protein EAH89_21950 [Roseomonas nepalensis]|uniref:Uncharacterized protein n=1 Tax=Muricoccus nepalensis TaxID=1854500 RepID=A0A502FIK3_9PROT|nr:hypothetical protein [Roseomonas nepalensis]TPG49224.1 hypothetical protein EAH89_21950 [Roseomonas nepalensis]